MSNKFATTKKGDPCPICGDVKGKCRRLAPDDQHAELRLCMSRADADAGATGWKYLGLTQNSLWGKYVADSGGDRWREAIARYQRYRERKPAIAPPLDRATRFRRFLESLDLADDHRENLRSRGLSDEAIAAGLYRTVAPDQKVEDFGDIPGVKDGRVAVAGRGFLCPALDASGRVIGAQIRLDQVDKGKYRWLKSDTSSHVFEDELPISVARGSDDQIALVEGILKPQIAAARHGGTWVGASGGNFVSSPVQVAEVLGELAGAGATIAFYPDGGAIANRHVCRRDGETIRFLRGLGYHVLVADWGQLWDSSAPDIDELESLEGVAFHEAGDFLELGEPEEKDPLDEWLEQHRSSYQEIQSKLAAIATRVEDEFERDFYALQLKREYKLPDAFFAQIKAKVEEEHEKRSLEPVNAIDYLWKGSDEGRQWLISTLVARQDVHLVYSAPGVGKTTFVLAAIAHMVLGVPFLGQKTRESKCLLISCDSPWANMSEYIEEIAILGLDDPESADRGNLEKIRERFFVLDEFSPARLAALEKYIASEGIDFVAIDSLTAVNGLGAEDENSPIYSFFLTRLTQIASRQNVTIWVIHHASRNGNARGTTALEGACTELTLITREDGEGDKKEKLPAGQRILDPIKTRTGREKMYVTRDSVTGNWSLLFEDSSDRELAVKVEDFLGRNPRRKFTASEIARSLEQEGEIAPSETNVFDVAEKAKHLGSRGIIRKWRAIDRTSEGKDYIRREYADFHYTPSPLDPIEEGGEEVF